MNENIKDKLIIALVQYQIEWNDNKANMSKIGEMLSEISTPADIVIFPETFNTGFDTNPEGIAETMDGETINWMKQLSVEKNSAVCGSMFIAENDSFFNRLVWVEPDGKILTYDKRHLYSMGGEDRFLTKGTERLIFEYKGWKICPQICYDLRFPVWARNTGNYDLMINVSNWPSNKAEIRTTLLKARAIENQCYAVGVNCVGNDGNKLTYNGLSLVADAEGIVLYNAGKSETVEIAVLDYEYLNNFRKKFNALKDRDNFQIIT
jgi:predicted amidohydrolase